ncbi:PQQ-dependent sugar dehydrogenase [Chloroflexota bacterium]
MPLPPSTGTAAPLGDPSAVLVGLELVVGGLDTPVGVTNAGDGSSRLFIVEKRGRIRVVQNQMLHEAPFLDIANRIGSGGSEQGLLGLAFHPDYGHNGLFFVDYTDLQGNSVISRFSVSSDPTLADPSSEVVLFTVNQPAANHNGGHLAFGADGYLYIGLGDGGGAGDQYGNGQNGGTLLGAILRIDVDGGPPYSVPPTNPFLGDGAVRDEIWAMGLRNPWRFSFDRLTDDLYIADVGQNKFEEVDLQLAGSPGGENYGWPIMEGFHCFPEDRSCDQSGLIPPVQEYDHSQGCSITGGYVYRGQEFPQLSGIYLFADYCSGTLWGMVRGSDGGRSPGERGDLAPGEHRDSRGAAVAQSELNPTAFGEDESGEIYLVNIGDGTLYKLLALSN